MCSTKCAVGPDEPKVVIWKDLSVSRLKCLRVRGVLKRDYFCLPVSACPILVFNYPIHLINSPHKGSGILCISMFLNILPKEDSTFLK